MPETRERELLLREILPSEWFTKPLDEVLSSPQKPMSQSRLLLPGKHLAHSGAEWSMIEKGLWNDLGDTYHFANSQSPQKRPGIMSVTKKLRVVGGYKQSAAADVGVLRPAFEAVTRAPIPELVRETGVLAVLATVSVMEAKTQVKLEEGRWPHGITGRHAEELKRIEQLEDEELMLLASHGLATTQHRLRNLNDHIASIEHHPVVEKIVYAYRLADDDHAPGLDEAA